MRILALAFIVLAAPRAGAETILVKAAHLIDGVADRRDGLAVLIDGERIKAVGPPADLARTAPGARVIDLGAATLLPGLIDAHTHLFLDDDITEGSYDAALLKDSVAYRAVQAAASARLALLYGFTSLRDLGTEGAMYADVDVKKAIERGVTPGPRLSVATRAMAPTAVYPLLGYAWDIRVPEGVLVADGPDGVRLAVREQVKHGADWIKLYADHGVYETGRADRPARSLVNYTPDNASHLSQRREPKSEQATGDRQPATGNGRSPAVARCLLPVSCCLLFSRVGR